MFGNLGRRAVECVVCLFAVLGFAFVPLGSKTGLEYTVSALRTRPVRDAVSGLFNAVGRAKARISETLLPGAADRAPLPLPSSAGTEVRPVVPELRPERPRTRSTQRGPG